ncbi:MAG: hypothetical protein RMA76_13885 [Deltaproteobacteria bacterium]|jgi:hypothetical protein
MLGAAEIRGRRVVVATDGFYAYDLGDLVSVDVGIALAEPLTSFAVCDDYFFAGYEYGVEYLPLTDAVTGGRIDAGWIEMAATPDCALVGGLAGQLEWVRLGDGRYGDRNVTAPYGNEVGVVRAGAYLYFMSTDDAAVRWDVIGGEGRTFGFWSPPARPTALYADETVVVGTDLGDFLSFGVVENAPDEAGSVRKGQIPGGDPDAYDDPGVVDIADYGSGYVYVAPVDIGVWDDSEVPCAPQVTSAEQRAGAEITAVVSLDVDHVAVHAGDEVHILQAEVPR